MSEITLDQIEGYVDRQLKSVKEDLISNLKYAIRELEGNVKRFEYDEESSVNKFGILQSTGATIDKLAGEYMTLREISRTIKGKSIF